MRKEADIEALKSQKTAKVITAKINVGTRPSNLCQI